MSLVLNGNYQVKVSGTREISWYWLIKKSKYLSNPEKVAATFHPFSIK